MRSAAVPEHEQRAAIDVVLDDACAAVECRQATRRTIQRQIRAQPVDVRLEANPHGQRQQWVGHFYPGDVVAGVTEARAECLLPIRPVLRKSPRVGVERNAATYHLHAFRRIGRRVHHHTQSEPIHELRSQVAFLRVHRADQLESRRMADGDPFAFDRVRSRRCHVQQKVDQVIGQQIDLVDVQHPAVCQCQQPWLEVALARPQRALEVERAGDSIL